MRYCSAPSLKRASAYGLSNGPVKPAGQAANIWTEVVDHDNSAQLNRLRPYRDAFFARYRPQPYGGPFLDPATWDAQYQFLNARGVTCEAFLKMSDEQQVRALRDAQFDPGTSEKEMDAQYPLTGDPNGYTEQAVGQIIEGMRYLCGEVVNGNPPPGTPTVLVNPWTGLEGVDPNVDPSKFEGVPGGTLTRSPDPWTGPVDPGVDPSKYTNQPGVSMGSSNDKVREPDSWTGGAMTTYSTSPESGYVDPNAYNTTIGQPSYGKDPGYYMPGNSYVDSDPYATHYGTPLNVPTATDEPRQLTAEEAWAAYQYCSQVSPDDKYWYENKCDLLFPGKGAGVVSPASSIQRAIKTARQVMGGTEQPSLLVQLAALTAVGYAGYAYATRKGR